MKKVYMLMAAAVMALTASAELNSAKTLDASVAPVEFEVTTATVNPFELKASSGDFSMKSLRDVTEFKIEQAPNRANASKLPIGDWMEKGTVEYTDDFLTSFYSDITPMTFEVAIEESFSTPGLYRLVDPYKAFAEANGFEYNGPAYIVIHAENEDAVYIETSLAGIVLPNYGEMIVMSDAALYLEAGYTLEQLMQYGVCGTYKNGVIKFPSSVLYVSAVNLGNQMAYGNTNGAFKVKFPGAKDYSLQVLTTECVVDNTIIVGFEVGEDVAAVKYGILTGGIYGFTEGNYQYIAEKGTEASNAVMQIELSAEDPAGRYTVLAAALDADGNYVAGDGTFFYNVIDNPEEWVSHGQGVYGEDIVSSIYKAFDPVVLQAEIQEHKDIPGYFRVVNPYANSFEAYEIESEHAAEDHNHYIFIDATDPENVVIEESVTGFDLGDGMVFLMSLPAYHESYDKPENYGKMTDKDDDTYLISFPVKSVVAGEMYYQKGAMSYANSNGGLFFEIPKAKSGVENVAVDNVKAEYFNLQGVRVAEPSNGIFIRREGSKVSKVMM